MHLAVGVDVASEAGVASAMEQTVTAFGAVDILVCSAGITGPNRTVWEYSYEDWKKVFKLENVIREVKAITEGTAVKKS